jgi:hypothetical protein
MQESSLHNSLKQIYTKPGDLQEANIDGFKIDVFSPTALIEIQTSNFSAIRPKLIHLLERYCVLLVHPIAFEKWIITYSGVGDHPLRERRSPRRGRVEDIFLELIYLSKLLNHQNLHVEVLLVREKEIRRVDGRGSWRRGGISVIDHQLVEIVSARRFISLNDWTNLLPEELPIPFTVNDLGQKLSMDMRLARKMAYCLRYMGVLKVVGVHGRKFLYDLSLKVYNS